MSGKRTKSLRRECARRLGRAPRKADGHVNIKAVSTPVRDHSGKGTIIHRFWRSLKAADRIQIDEFRFLKRHGCMPAEARTERARQVMSQTLHKLHVDRNNQRLEDLRKEAAA